MRLLSRSALAAAAALTLTASAAVAVAVAPTARAGTSCSFAYGSTGNGTTVSVQGSCTTTSSTDGGGGGGSSSIPPPCWLAPRFTGKAMWDLMNGTGTGGLTSQQFFLAIPRPGDDKKYKDDTQESQGVWWVPVSDGTPAGDACAYGLYWPEWGPPPSPGVTTLGGNPTMSVETAAAVAYAHLQLPDIQVSLNRRSTDPANPTKTYVNLPTWVEADYTSPVSDTATISIPIAGGAPFQVSATVTATEKGGLDISVPPGTGDVVTSGCQNDGDTGSLNQGSGMICGVKFTQPSPSGDAPYPVTVTTTWDITGPGVQATRTKSGTASAIVDEIQSVSGG